MRTIQTFLVAALLGALSTASATAQHTFSIVAVDPETGEVGSAGASCVPFDVHIIGDVHPGIGAINTQARYSEFNQAYGRGLMARGMGAQEIVDSLVLYDDELTPEIRQYGVVTLAGTQKSAAYTGNECFDYKGHITGPTYSIQGNILLGRQILDSMEARFLRANGTLADRLMAALQGANVIGADTRCAPYSSSHSAFILVAKPGDAASKPWLFLEVSLGGTSQLEPLDSLQRTYDRWKANASSVQAARPSPLAAMEIVPNPGRRPVARIVLERAADVAITLYDALGQQRADAQARMQAGRHEISPATDALPAGNYYIRLSADGNVMTKRLVLER